MLPIKQAIKRCFNMPHQITCASALPGKTGKHENHIFYSNGVLVESAAAVGLCCTHNAVFLKEKLSSVLCLIACTFVETVRYPINTVRDEEQLSSFTQWPTPWQSWLTQTVGNRILGPVWCIQSIFLTVNGGSVVIKWYFNAFCVVFGKKHATFQWKDTIFVFPVSPGSAEAQVRWSGKMKYILIAYFLGNTRAKNYHNRMVYVKIIASQRWDVFWDTV